jgi:hypothetical protein
MTAAGIDVGKASLDLAVDVMTQHFLHRSGR